MNPRIATTALLVAVAAAGCGKKKDSADRAPDPSHDKAEPAAEAPAAEAPAAAKPLTADFFGKTVAPPAALAKLAWGSTPAAARKAAPELFPKPGDEGFQLSDAAGLDHVSYGVGFDDETKLLSRLYVQMPKTGAALVATAWGKGMDAVDSLGKPRTYWFDAGAGWRAYVEQGFGDDVNLELSPYLPAAKLLGDGVDTVGFAPQGVLSATVGDLRTRFGAALIETSAAQAQAEQKKVGAMAGTDLDKTLGAAQPSVRIDLPPTEWGEFWTRVQIDWGDDGKVEDFWFDLPYEAYGPAKDEIMALLKKKWGEPKEGLDLGDKVLVFHAKAPYVVVKDDDIGKAWNVRIRAAAPE